MKSRKAVLKGVFLWFLLILFVTPAFAGAFGAKVHFTGKVIQDEMPTWRYCGDYFVTIRVQEIWQNSGSQLNVGQELPVYYAAAQGLRRGDIVDVRGTSCLVGGPMQCMGSVVVLPAHGDYIGLTVQTMADVNGDNVINLLDLVAVTLAYHKGESTFDLRTDLNGDGAVNLLDVVLVCKNYGQRWGD